MLSDIFVLLDQSSERAGIFAQSLAAEYGAFVTAGCPAVVEPFVAVSYSHIGYDFPTRLADEQLELSHAALARFEARASRLELQAETIKLDADEQSIVALARTFDLIVFEQRDAARPKATDPYIEPVLLQSGRPCLGLPYIGAEAARFKTVTIAWDGSASAARAVADAMPFLERADRVHVAALRETIDERPGSAARLSKHLARHHIDAEWVTFPKRNGVVDTLLSLAVDAGSDLLVMGAYDHSPMRERLVGGASRDILRTMTVPVLMSHA